MDSKRLVAVEDNLPAKDDLFRIEWNLGKRCNYDCSYCSPTIHDKKSEHLPFDIFTRTVDRLVGIARARGQRIRISLTGGEPFLHPEIFKMLEYMKSNGVNRLSLTSNSSIPAATYARAYEFIDYLILSCHFEFAKPERLERTYLALNEHVQLLHAQGQAHKNLHVHLMALPTQFEKLERMVSFCRQEKIPHVIRRIRPQANAEGGYLRPFNSGQLGGFRLNRQVLAEAPPYYAENELRFLGVEA